MKISRTTVFSLIFMSLIPNTLTAQFMGGLENFTLLDVKLAYSIPVGEYGETGSSDFETGYATGGINLSGGVYYMFNDLIGAGGTLNYSLHGYDEAARRRAIFDNDPTVTSATVESTRYSNWVFTGGPVLNGRISEKLAIVLRGEVGIMLSVRPSQNFTITNINGTNSVSLDRITGTSFAYNLGGMIRFHASEVVALNLMVDYIAGNPEYDYLTYDAPNWIEIQGKQSVNTIKLGMGVSYIIGY